MGAYSPTESKKPGNFPLNSERYSPSLQLSFLFFSQKGNLSQCLVWIFQQCVQHCQEIVRLTCGELWTEPGLDLFCQCSMSEVSIQFVPLNRMRPKKTLPMLPATRSDSVWRNCSRWIR